MKSPTQYETIEEMEECRKKAEIEIEKLHKKLGFVVFEVVENMRLERMDSRQRREYYQRKCRGGSCF